MKNWHWAIVIAVLTAIWLGFMIYMSIENYRDKDPKRIQGRITDPSLNQSVN